MTRDLKSQLRAYTSDYVSTVPPIEIDEILGGRDQPLRHDEIIELRGDNLTVGAVGIPDENPASPPAKRRAAVLAVAAVIVLVVGVVVVTDRNDSNVATETVSSATTADAVPSPTVPDPTPRQEEAGPSPSFVDSLGYRWSRVPHDEAIFGGVGLQLMNDVTSGGLGLVAVGSDRLDAAVWVSVDGLTWSRVPHDDAVFGGDRAYKMHEVIAGGPGLVAIGTMRETDGDDDRTVAWTSVDGITWALHEDAFGGSGPGAGTVPGPGLVVGGEMSALFADEVWTSAHGVTWSQVPNDDDVFGFRVLHGNGMLALTVGGPGYVAVGSDGLNSDAPTGRARAVVWTSVDGLTWSRVAHDEAVFGGDGDQGLFDVTVGGPGLVAVGEDAQGAPIWTSSDGITWSQIPDHDDVFGYGDARVGPVVAGDLGLVAFGDLGGDPTMWTSDDGITWTREALPEGADASLPRGSDWYPGGRAIAGGPGLVAVGSRNGDAAVWVATPEN